MTPKAPVEASIASWLPRWMGEIGWRTLLAGVLLGGIVHICATFAAPILGSGLAYQRLSDGLPVNRMVALPAPSASKQTLPFLPPDTLYAICRYDLTGGPVSVTAALSGPGWVLSLHSREGDNFYALPGQQLREDKVSFLLVPGGTLEAAHVRPTFSTTDTQVVSPTAEGLIVVRAPVIGVAWSSETEAILRQSSCTQVKRAT
jgi:uncharacterized membrane protein